MSEGERNADQVAGDEIDLIRRHYDAFNRGDLDAVIDTLTPDVSIFGGDELGGPGERFRGRDDAYRFFAEIKQIVTDNHIEILSLEAKPGRVEASVRLHGRLRESDVSGSVPAVHFFTIRDGLIARIETYRPNWRAGI